MASPPETTAEKPETQQGEASEAPFSHHGLEALNPDNVTVTIHKGQDFAQKPASARGMSYPWGTDKPAPGTVREVVKGIYWVRLPLPGSLDHINAWVIEDGFGYVVIDTGLNLPVTKVIWEQIFTELMNDMPVTKLILTHMHPDHSGLAGWFVERFGCKLHMSRTEYLYCRVLLTDTGKPAPEVAVKFYQGAGWSEPAVERYKERFGLFGTAVLPLPDSYQRLQGGDTLEIGDHTWRVLRGAGHSPEHMSFFCEALGVYISGDQVLPRISSNVSVWPTEPESDPLDDWIEACAHQKEQLPEDCLVLPAHNTPFYGLHVRLTQLISSHVGSLERLIKGAGEGLRVVDTFPALFLKGIDKGELLMATGEAYAHLNYLRHRGFIMRELHAGGVYYYSATAKPASREALLSPAVLAALGEAE